MVLAVRRRQSDPIPSVVVAGRPLPFDADKVPCLVLLAGNSVHQARLDGEAVERVAALSPGRWATGFQCDLVPEATDLIPSGPAGGWTQSYVDVMLDTALHGLGTRRGGDAFVLNIGAMDGVSFDGTRSYVNAYGWKGLFVEPIPELFGRLVESFAGVEGVRFERAAIASADGEVEMLRMPIGLVDAAVVHPAFGGMSTLLPARNGMASEADRAIVERHGVRIRVPGLTLKTLLDKHRISEIDLLHIDVEGYDWAVLQQFDFERYRPAIVRLEWTSLDETEQQCARARLVEYGYQVEQFYDELLGFDRTNRSR